MIAGFQRLTGGAVDLGAVARGAVMPALTLAVILFMILPLPPALLDAGFIFNIMLSLAVLMVALNARAALDFSSFPTVLLFATLLRLSLNVASTRVVLVSGHEGPGAAGRVIEAFGHFLIGGDYIVGLFVFAILMIINLVVITKGAGRVSEVSARFTLDALPGKQMAIDADLNAGLVTPEEARARRAEVATEADFYGSMDGASKFVKGDAIAGVLILLVNIIGGIVLGMVSHGLSAGKAAETYILLAIGDALVAQVPALLLSIAAAAVVTRVASPLDLSGQIGSQFGHSAAWIPVTAILTLIGVMPGMPHLVVLPAAALSGWIAWRLRQREVQAAEAARTAPVPVDPPHHIRWDEVADTAGIALDIGVALVPLVDEGKGAPLMARITGIRRQVSRDLGFVVPPVRVRDDLTMTPTRYRIAIAGVVVGEGEVFPDDLLALDAGGVDIPVDGRATVDPAFGMPAVWIAPSQRADAVVAGYTVVDAATAITTHLNQLIHAQAADLFGLDEARALLDALRLDAPLLVDALVPPAWPLVQVAAVARGLLHEGVSLRDAKRIGEAMVAIPDAAGQPAAALVEAVRRPLARHIVQRLAPAPLPLTVVTLDAGLEGLVADAVRLGQGDAGVLDPALAQRLMSALAETVAPLIARGKRPALVTAPGSRPVLARLLRVPVPDLAVLSFLEIPDAVPVEVAAVIGGADPPLTATPRDGAASDAGHSAHATTSTLQPESAP